MNDNGRVRFLWLGPLVGFLLYATGLMSDEVIDPVSTWLREKSTPVISAIVVGITLLVIWILVRRERGRRRRIAAIRDRVVS